MDIKKTSLYILIAGISLLLIGTLIYILNSNIDTFCSKTVLTLQHSILDMPIKVLSLFGTPPAILTISIIVTIALYIYNMKRELIFYLVTIILTATTASLIKELTARDRPYPKMEDISSYSFVSWHASISMALSIAIILILASRDFKYRWWLLIWGFSIGFTRIYLNVHWCSDVLAGWGVGASISALAGYFILTKYN